MIENLEEKTKMAKIIDGENLWHRMGDVGYLDENNSLWFCGRKDHRVTLNEKEVLFTIPCEAIFNQHPKVNRTALILSKNKQGLPEAVIVIELAKEYWNGRNETLAHEILQLGQKFEHTKKIKKAAFYQNFPVDVRHNAKIDRELLSSWAQAQEKMDENASKRNFKNMPSLFFELKS